MHFYFSPHYIEIGQGFLDAQYMVACTMDGINGANAFYIHLNLGLNDAGTKNSKEVKDFLQTEFKNSERETKRTQT